MKFGFLVFILSGFLTSAAASAANIQLKAGEHINLGSTTVSCETNNSQPVAMCNYGVFECVDAPVGTACQKQNGYETGRCVSVKYDSFSKSRACSCD